MSWRDLLVIVDHGPETSALARAQRPHPAYRADIDLLRLIEFRLHQLVWSKTEDASRGWNAPEMVRLPWDGDPEGTIRGDAMTIDEVNDFLGWSAQLAQGNGVAGRG